MEENPESLSFKEKLRRMELLSKEAASYFPSDAEKIPRKSKNFPATKPKTKSSSHPLADMKGTMKDDSASQYVVKDNVKVNSNNHGAPKEKDAKFQRNQDNLDSVSGEQTVDNIEDFSTHKIIHSEKKNDNQDSLLRNTTKEGSHGIQVATDDVVKTKEKEMMRIFNTETEVIYENIPSDLRSDLFCFQGYVEQTNLLLLGKTGNGKSSLGNSILGHAAFESKASMESVTKHVTYDVTETNGARIKVVDGPGVGDTRVDEVESTRLILTAMSKAISLSPQGYHAFLLVVKFGGRFTEEDRHTVIILKKIFGEHFFKKFFIIVMTCGDKFEEEVKTSFSEWVEEQNNGVFGELLQECNKRIILFDNTTKDKDKKTKQLNSLLKIIHDLKQQNCCYSDEHFNTALITRNSLLVEAEKVLIQEEILVEAHLIIQRLQHILETVKAQHSAPFLKDILQRADALYESVNEKDQGTGVMYDLALNIWSLISSIIDEIAVSENMKKQMENFKKKKKDEVKLFAEELRLQREMFEEFYREGRETDEKRNAMLQQQMDSMNEKVEQLRKEKDEFESNGQAVWGVEQEKVRSTKEKVKKIKDKQVQLNEEKISKGVFTKFARFMRLRKSDDEYEEIDC